MLKPVFWASAIIRLGGMAAPSTHIVQFVYWPLCLLIGDKQTHWDPVQRLAFPIAVLGAETLAGGIVSGKCVWAVVPFGNFVPVPLVLAEAVKVDGIEPEEIHKGYQIIHIGVGVARKLIPAVLCLVA